MPDINLVSISPSQLSGTAEAGLYDASAFQTKYLAQGGLLVLDRQHPALVDDQPAAAHGAVARRRGCEGTDFVGPEQKLLDQLRRFAWTSSQHKPKVPSLDADESPRSMVATWAAAGCGAASQRLASSTRSRPIAAIHPPQSIGPKAVAQRGRCPDAYLGLVVV